MNAVIFDGGDIEGTSLASQDSILGSAFTFTQNTFIFSALSDEAILAFIDNSTETIGSDLLLDHVQVSLVSVPEPSSTLLWIAIVTGIGLQRRRR